MAFRNNCFATVWETRPVIRADKTTGSCTDVRLTTSKKKNNQEYETDFSGFVRFIGDAHKMAAGLKPRDKIKLNEVACTGVYDKTANKTTYNFQCYSFSPADGTPAAQKVTYDPVAIPEAVTEEELPFN